MVFKILHIPSGKYLTDEADTKEAICELFESACNGWWFIEDPDIPVILLFGYRDITESKSRLFSDYKHLFEIVAEDV